MGTPYGMNDMTHPCPCAATPAPSAQGRWVHLIAWAPKEDTYVSMREVEWAACKRP